MSTDGTHEIRGGTHVLRYERHLAHPVDRVWRALTEPGELRGWLADADIEPRPGGHVELRWLNTDDQGNTAVARGTVARFEPPRVVEYDTDIHGRLRWELAPEGDGETPKYGAIATASMPIAAEPKRPLRASSPLVATAPP